MGLKVADLFAELSLKDQGFDRQLDRKKGLLGGLGPMAAKAGLAVGVGLAAGAAKAVSDFSGFQRQMNEVFTLLPGISGDAMAAMEGQVKDFSKTFGVLPNEVVPALYQSLSAGVPPGNVFEFLETAQQAAKGGVTDLTTAVDGISSVVNAYGDQISGAAEASDLMFTAVKLGKTNFEELSRSLFNVIPTAAGLGVEFGDVTASLAALTAQGTPTSVATTQMRQMFVELSKAGSATAGTFEDIAGKTFQEFIAGGGSVQDALDMLAGEADRTGVRVADMFGSVEAGAAASALTSQSGSEAVRKAMAEMAESGGATQAAFEQMEQGIGPVWDKLKANASVALLDLGDKLAPVVETLGNLALKALPAVGDAFETLWGFVQPVVDLVSSAVTGMADDSIGGAASKISGLLGEGGPVAAAMDLFRGLFETARDFIDDHMGQVQEIIGAVLEAVSVVWELFGDDIVTFVTRTFDAIMRIVGGALDIIQGIFETVLGILTGDWSRAWDGIKQILGGVWQVIIGIIERAWATIQLIVGVAFDALRAAVGGGVENVLQFFRDMPGNILAALGNLGGLLRGAARDLIDGFIGGIRAKFNDVKDTLRGLTSKLTSWKGPASVDRKLLREPARLIMSGFADDLARMAEQQVRPVLAGLTASMPDIALSGVPGQAPFGVAEGAHARPVRMTVLLDGRVLAESLVDPLADEVEIRTGVTR